MLDATTYPAKPGTPEQRARRASLLRAARIARCEGYDAAWVAFKASDFSDRDALKAARQATRVRSDRLFADADAVVLTMREAV